MPSSIAVCQTDPNTVVNLANGITYDLMISAAVGCYPAVGTIDYSTYSLNNDEHCASGDLGIANRRVLFSSYLFNGSMLTGPLQALLMTGTDTAHRATSY